MPSIFVMMPDYVMKPNEVIYWAKTIDLKVGKLLNVTYLDEYPENPIKFTVVFKGHNGGTKILEFFVIPTQVQQINKTEYLE